jgi:hypothetical protein
MHTSSCTEMCLLWMVSAASASAVHRLSVPWLGAPHKASRRVTDTGSPRAGGRMGQNWSSGSQTTEMLQSAAKSEHAQISSSSSPARTAIPSRWKQSEVHPGHPGPNPCAWTCPTPRCMKLSMRRSSSEGSATWRSGAFMHACDRFRVCSLPHWGPLQMCHSLPR